MRKLVKRYQWGGYTTPYNTATSTYQSIMGTDYAQQLSDNFRDMTASSRAQFTVGSKLGDPLSMLIKGNSDTNKAIGKVKELGKLPGSSVKTGLFSKANIGSTMNIAGQAADVIGSLIPKKEQSALTTGLNSGYDAAANAVSMIPGVGTVIGGAMKVGGLLSDGLTAMGVGTDQMTTTDKILDSKFMKLTPMGLINSLGAKRSDTITRDNQAFEEVGASYGGTGALVDSASEKSGKKYGLMSGRGLDKANREILKAKTQQSTMSNIAEEARNATLVSNNPLLGLGTQLQLNGGYQQRDIRLGKLGLKVDKDLVKRVVKLSKGKKSKAQKVQEEVAGFKNGGAVNVIPDGALHAHKHHLEDVDDKFEEVTAKGIPVITESKGGDVTQHAEVERNEIIFNLEVTKKLEKLKKEGTDEAAIEAGKLLVTEILHNTVDNTGLLNIVE